MDYRQLLRDLMAQNKRLKIQNAWLKKRIEDLYLALKKERRQK